MSVGLYADVHIQRVIVDELRLRGVDVLRSQDDGTRLLPDDLLLARSTELDRVLFTYDDDLLAIAATWQRTSKRFAGVIFARARDLRIGPCIDQLEALLKDGDPPAFNDRVTYLSFSLR